MVDATGHAANVVRDYARMRAIGIRVIRESVGWWRSERDGRIDLDGAKRRAEAAHRAGLSIIWTLWHYGWPDDVSLFDDALAERFADFARKAAAAVSDPSDPRPLFSPVNEISFLAWAITESALIHPFRGGGPDSQANGYALKMRLVRAALAGCVAIRDVIPGARLLHVDPIVHIVAPPDRPDRAEDAARLRAYQFQAWDMLSGRTEPQLGGAPSYVDFVGVNYYHANQFELDSEQRLHWHLADARRAPLRRLLREVYERYQCPLLLAETSHFGVGRSRWLLETATEVRGALDEGAHVAGICLYPITDRPDWENPSHWHHSGIWDRTRTRDGVERDRLNLPYLRALRSVQADFGDAGVWTSAGGNVDDLLRNRVTAMIVVLATRWRSLPDSQRERFLALARRWSMIVIEPIPGGEATPTQCDGIRFGTLPAAEDTDVDEALPDAVDAALEAIASSNAYRVGVWLQTPLALPMIEHIVPDVVVYEPDAQLTTTTRADPRFLQRHRALLTIADVQVTAGDRANDVVQRVDAVRDRGMCAGARAMLGVAFDDDLPRFRASKRTPATRMRAATRRRQTLRCDCLIIGAGATGLAAAHAFGEGSLLVERDVTAGGSRRSTDDLGYVFDATPTIIDRRGSELDALYQMLLGDNVAWHAKRIAFHGNRSAHRDADDGGFSVRNHAVADATPESIGYPIHGGMQALIDGFLPLMRGEYLRHANVVRIEPAHHVAWLDDGHSIRYRRLIATVSLPSLVSLLGDHVPANVAAAAARLQTVSLRCVNIGVRASPPLVDWIAFGDDAPFDRVVVLRNCTTSRDRECVGIVCELPHSSARPLPTNGSALINACVDACIERGVFDRRGSVVVAHEIETPVAAVIDSHPAHANVGAIEAWLMQHDIAFGGSRGRWEPGRTFDALIEGSALARAARAALNEHAARPALNEHAARQAFVPDIRAKDRLAR